MKINIAVCDDEKRDADKLEALVQNYAGTHGLEVKTETYYDAGSLLEGPVTDWQILFLDVKLGRENGIELARRLREQASRAILIYVSAYIEMAPRGYEVQAFRYLLKKDLEKTFPYTMEDALGELKRRQRTYLVQSQKNTTVIPLDEILYFESFKRYVLIHTLRGEYKQYRKISQLEEELKDQGFCRIYKSYLVSLGAVEKFEDGEACLKNGVRLPCSRANYKEILNRYILWEGRS